MRLTLFNPQGYGDAPLRKRTPKTTTGCCNQARSTCLPCPSTINRPGKTSLTLQTNTLPLAEANKLRPAQSLRREGKAKMPISSAHCFRPRRSVHSVFTSLFTLHPSLFPSAARRRVAVVGVSGRYFIATMRYFIFFNDHRLVRMCRRAKDLRHATFSDDLIPPSIGLVSAPF
jgi:hypothetical protein